MKNIHVLPTDKPSRLSIIDSQLIYSKEYFINPQHIYITSDEEIKEGDWFFRDGSIHKCFRVHRTDIEFLTSIDSVYCGSNTFWSKEFCQKIILTTDQDLIKDDIQEIDETFLEWYVNNPSCEFVDIERGFLTLTGWVKSKDTAPKNLIRYKIIIPQEEPKQETLEEAYQRGYERGLNVLIPLIEKLNKEITELKRKGI